MTAVPDVDATDVNAPDPHTTAGKIAELQRRNEASMHAGSEKAIAKQHKKGKMTARERILTLLDDDASVRPSARAP